MKKTLGFICLFGSLIWCFLLFPVSIAPLASLIYPYGIFESLQEWLTTSKPALKCLVALFMPYAVFKFGISIVRSSLNMISGKKDDTQQKRVRALIEKKLNKSQNVNTPSGSDAA